MSYGIWRNNEGYSDPTAGAAMSSIIRKERSDRRKAIRRQHRRLRKQAAYRLDRNTPDNPEKEAAQNDG